MIQLLIADYDDCSMGRLFTKGFSCYVLGLPWKNNAQDKSRIPFGTYRYEVRNSPSRGRDVIWILNVQGRTNVQIHPGNYTRQILGCFLVGDGVRDLDGDGIPDVTNSGNTFDKLLANIPKQGEIFIGSSTT
jgi:hypothetical protein